MRRLILLSLLLILAACASAFAETAEDITKTCKINVGQDQSAKNLYDRDETTSVSIKAQTVQALTVTPGDIPVAGVYVEFGTYLHSIAVDTKNEDGSWTEIARYDNIGYAEAYLSFPAQSGKFRVRFYRDNGQLKVTLREMYLYSEGEMNEESARLWNAAPDKTDILFVVAHPDDEILWFGGAIPYTAGELKKDVQVAYLQIFNVTRRLELLNGLWTCGVRVYPDFVTPEGALLKNQQDDFHAWKDEKVMAHCVRLLRQYKPDVLVTHDKNGEYGHWAHVETSRLMLEAIACAADENYDGGTLAQYGTWQVKKAYVHLGENATTVMDWHQPLNAFDGLTAFEVAEKAWDCHVTQHWCGLYEVADVGDDYDSTRYTLVFSAVGEDVAGNDFFENIP